MAKNDQDVSAVVVESISESILLLRGQKVMLDFTLAELYGVQTKVLNQAVRRNLERFPEDFMFQLTKSEFVELRSQSATSNQQILFWKVEKRIFRQTFPHYALPVH